VSHSAPPAPAAALAGHGAAIALTRCAKTFADGTRALEPLDLSIAAGETLVLLGPSGCGKTTTLRIIAGLEAPDAGGTVTFDGADVTALPIEKRHVGMVFQSYALFPNMNVVENVSYGLRVRGVAKAERLKRAAEVLEMMRIDALATRRIDQLSGGQRQRVALARALAVRPRAILLDEPLTALDAALREHLRTEIDALLRSLAITAIYVTHDQAEALALGDRIVVMRQGAIAQIGTPREIYFKPADAFVAAFVGTTNRLEGSVRNGRFETAAGFLSHAGADAAQAALAFRPEVARICRLEETGLHFTIAQVHFLGARQRVVLTAPDDSRIIVETAPEEPLTLGACVGLAIDPSRLVLV
jgi:putative spermidine/putrescine transport system ATP-binding protein